MKSNIVPMFSITNASMQEAVGALQYASIQFDPRRGAGGPYGVGFVLLTPKASRRISVSETNISLYALIRICCDEANMAYSLYHGTMMIEDRTGHERSSEDDVTDP